MTMDASARCKYACSAVFSSGSRGSKPIGTTQHLFTLELKNNCPPDLKSAKSMLHCTARDGTVSIGHSSLFPGYPTEHESVVMCYLVRVLEMKHSILHGSPPPNFQMARGRAWPMGQGSGQGYTRLGIPSLCFPLGFRSFLQHLVCVQCALWHKPIYSNSHN